MNALVRTLQRTEHGLVIGIFALAMGLPILDSLSRAFGGFHLKGSADLMQQVTLWLVFLGALAATRQTAHLTLSTSAYLGKGPLGRLAHLGGHAIAAAVTGVLAYASAKVVLANRIDPRMLSIGIPAWVSEIVMPVSLAAMAVKFALLASPVWRGRLVAFLAIPAGLAIGLLSPEWAARTWPLILLILLGVFAGAPVFVAMGGVALVLFFRDGTPVAAVSAEVYRLVASPTLPAIPLLAAAGYVLAESNAAERLVRLFRALFGWMPGGLAVMVAAVCAAFTTFTGGSGVTIIALGGLVYPMLRRDGYSEAFSLGLVTTSGALGLLLPPSLPVILYSIVASSREVSVPADRLFLAGFLPGLLLLALTVGYGIWIGRKASPARSTFSWQEARAAVWLAKWEVLLPLFMIGLFTSGLATMIETAAAALAFAVVTQCLVTRDIHVRRDLPRVLLKVSALMGAVLILLSVAMGLTNYLVDAQIPDALMRWAILHLHSQVAFLLVLNAILLVLGSVLEIYSAIIVLAPLVAPLGAAFGVHPVHLGIIFLANLEVGFLLPPVGLNLFLASSRFGKLLPQLYRAVLPFLLILGIGLILITYLPSLSLALPRWLGKG
jgi:tripartite ATP-independent transporter DctM subunit